MQGYAALSRDELKTDRPMALDHCVKHHQETLAGVMNKSKCCVLAAALDATRKPRVIPVSTGTVGRSTTTDHKLNIIHSKQLVQMLE